MTSGSGGQEVLESIVAALPEMAHYIGSIPDGQKATALAALESHYLKTAINLGYSEEPVRMWVAAVMAHLRERLDQMTELRPANTVVAVPGTDYTLAEILLTRAIGALVLLVAFPLIAFIWVGLKLERSDPAVVMRTSEQRRIKAYTFALGSGWVSRFVRRADLRSIPMLWHLVNGDAVLRFKDFAEVIQFPSAIRPRSN
jgi:hypothetical protein